MRKLLLATVAVLGASIGVASVADAQTASPAPGTITVRLNGRFRFYAYGGSISEADNNAAGSATGTVNAAGQGTLTGTNKLADYGFGDYIRLYPGFDGVAANGLKYGASIEIRQDESSGSGGGTFGSVSAQDRARGGLYVRREWGYVGTDQLGTIRLGSTDQPSSLYMTGNFENFDGGGLNGDLPSAFPGNEQITWPFADVGSYYTTEKAIYLSPQLFGFDFGVSYEPSTANVNFGASGCGAGTPVGANFVNSLGSNTTAGGASSSGAASPGCDALSSSPINSESGRRRNTVDALIRYRGTFGAFGIAATAGLIEGSHVLDNQSGVAFNANSANGLPIRYQYQGLSVGDFGVALTYGGFSVGGKYQIGKFNNQWALLPQNAGLHNSEAFLVGASYTVGPFVVGAHYLNYVHAGDIGNAVLGRQQREQGVGYGGTYSVAPGVSLFLSGIWQERKQNGYNFNTGQGVSAAAPAGNPYNNKISSNLISIGTSFSW
jgi:predicted porin